MSLFIEIRSNLPQHPDLSIVLDVEHGYIFNNSYFCCPGLRSCEDHWIRCSIRFDIFEFVRMVPENELPVEFNYTDFERRQREQFYPLNEVRVTFTL